MASFAQIASSSAPIVIGGVLGGVIGGWMGNFADNINEMLKSWSGGNKVIMTIFDVLLGMSVGAGLGFTVLYFLPALMNPGQLFGSVRGALGL